MVLRIRLRFRTGTSVSVPGSGCYSALFFWFAITCSGLTKLVFHLLAVANLSDPLENDLVVHIKSRS